MLRYFYHAIKSELQVRGIGLPCSQNCTVIHNRSMSEDLSVKPLHAWRLCPGRVHEPHFDKFNYPFVVQCSW